MDSAAVQDGFQLYHHTFLFTPDGTWAVVQQGMNEATGRARRYHWLTPPRFDADPHAAVAGAQGQGVLNGSIACCSRPTRRSPRTNTGLLAVRGARAVREARTGRTEKVAALRRLAGLEAAAGS